MVGVVAGVVTAPGSEGVPVGVGSPVLPLGLFGAGTWPPEPPGLPLVDDPLVPFAPLLATRVPRSLPVTG